MSGITYHIGDLESLRKQFGPWYERNSPVPDGDTDKRLRQMMRMSMGMSEELGELVDANYDQDVNEGLDAIADIAIYSLSFMWFAKLEVQEVLLFGKQTSRYEAGPHADPVVEEQRLMDGLTYFIGRLSHHTLKEEQSIRKNEDHWHGMRFCLCYIWKLMYRLSERSFARDLNELVKAVASEVLKRDWQKNPDTAHEDDEREDLPSACFTVESFKEDSHG